VPISNVYEVTSNIANKFRRKQGEDSSGPPSHAASIKMAADTRIIARERIEKAAWLLFFIEKSYYKDPSR
jgi:hypothetical protein